MSLYTESIRDVLMQGPATISDLHRAIPRASVTGIRDELFRMEERGEARVADRRYRHGKASNVCVWEAIL